MTLPDEVQAVLKLLLFSGLGAMLVGFGAASHFSGIEVIPLGFPGNGILLMLLGVLLMLPMTAVALTRILRSLTGRDDRAD